MIDGEEEREFLLTQRESKRRGCMVGFDKSFQYKKENKKKNSKILRREKGKVINKNEKCPIKLH